MMIKTILEIINQYPDIEAIKINHSQFIKIMQEKSSHQFLDIITDRTMLQSGHYANLFGVNIIIDKMVLDNSFLMRLNGKWQIPIKFENVNDIHAYLKLKAFL